MTRKIFSLFAVAVLSASSALSGAALIERAGDGEVTVLWLSIDGFRADYVDRAPAEFIGSLRERSYHTGKLRPVFPSLTFPSHVSQATGVTVDRHGIPSNSFFDREKAETLRYPGPQDLLEAEPIWTTATRQGIRTLVYDWPLSHDQRGEQQADYFGVRFDGSLSDEERLQRILATWRADTGDRPLRLIMGYIVGTDSVGHRFGPESEEVLEKTREVDAAVEAFLREAVDIWRERAADGDELFVFLTTDHGMSEVDFNVNAELMLGLPRSSAFEVVTGGNVGHVFLPDGMPESERAAAIANFKRRVGGHAFAKAYTQAEVPEALHYRHPTRIGDLVLILDDGYTFNRMRPEVVYPSGPGSGPLGMHGYAVDGNEEMKGFALVARFPQPLDGPVDLGVVDSLRLHPTVCRLLGIEPAEGAVAEPL